MIVLQWRQPPPLLRLRWGGPAARSGSRSDIELARPVVAIIGPPGLAGSAGTTLLSGQAELMLPPGRGVCHWEAAVAAPGVLPGMTALVQLAPASDDAENDAEWIGPVSLTARAATDSLTRSITLANPASGPVPIIWSAF